MEFTQDDYLHLIAKLDYMEYKLTTLDARDLGHAKEIILLKEYIENLNNLLNQWRALQRRKGFTVLKGGRS